MENKEVKKNARRDKKAFAYQPAKEAVNKRDMGALNKKTRRLRGRRQKCSIAHFEVLYLFRISIQI